MSVSNLVQHNVKLSRAANCFFAVVLFSAEGAGARSGASGSREQSGRRTTRRSAKHANEDFGLVTHGGAGTIERSKMTPERERQYRAGIERGLSAGYEILKRGGSSLDATEAAVRVFEDDPNFNAGRGSVFTNIGTNELDAAVMDGKTLRAGAVACLEHIKNPVSLARLVMEKSGHVMMAGKGAEGVCEGERGGFCRAKIFLYKGTLGCFGKGESGREKRRIGR